MGTGTWIALLLASIGARNWIDYTPVDPDRSTGRSRLGRGLFFSLRLTMRLFGSVGAALDGTTS